MISAVSLERYLGRAVHVFGTDYDENGDLRLIVTARLVAIEDNCLAVGSDEVPPGDIDWVLDLRLVGAVAAQGKAPAQPLRAMDGGRAGRPRREPEPA